MASFLKIFIPQDKKFFSLFERGSGNLLSISELLVKMVNTPDADERTRLIKEIENLEHAGDAISHEIFNELSTNFITPFDREDIHALTSSIDDIVDYIHGSAKRIQLYKVDKISPSIIKLSELILEGSRELHRAINELRNLKNIGKIKEACVRINSIENHADDIFDMAIAKLFEEEQNAVMVIKYKEVLSALETATDKCEDAANVLESILVKNA